MKQKVNHHIKIPEKYLTDLKYNHKVLQKEIEAGNLPVYDVFVEGLFKYAETPILSLHHCTTGITKEAAELLSESCATWIHGKPLKCHDVIKEMGDVYFYFQQLLNMMGLTLEEIQSVNYLKLLERYGGLTYSDKAAQEKVDQKKPGANRKFFGQNSDNKDD